jgi:calcium binding protein 39
VIDGFHHLITSDNYVTKRQSIKLLGEVLLERTNFNVMMRYINDPENLKLMMTLLKGESKNIQTEAFHVFKVFVANPNKSDAVAHILYANRQRLIVFLSNFKTSEKESAQIKEEKDILLATLQNMAEPPGYEAISPMVTPPPQ